MTVRYAVLCERIRTRARNKRGKWSEERLRITEEYLGFPLPGILRALYREIGIFDLGDYCVGYSLAQLSSALISGQEPPFQIEDGRLSSQVAEALRRHPGSYVELGVDGIPADANGEYVPLTMSQSAGSDVLLDLRTGYLYYDYRYAIEPRPDEIWFCAPSVEDWLERELDASGSDLWRYQPTTLATILEAEGLRLAELATEADNIQPQEDTLDPAQARRNARRETKRLREENLSDEWPDSVKGIGSVYRNDRVIHWAGWELEQARRQLLRQMYALMEIIEAKQEKNQEDAPKEAKYMKELRPLIKADAQLASLIAKIRSGTSDLYR